MTATVTPIEPLPPDKHPDAVYLAGLAEGMGRVIMPSTLNQAGGPLPQSQYLSRLLSIP